MSSEHNLDRGKGDPDSTDGIDEIIRQSLQVDIGDHSVEQLRKQWTLQFERHHRQRRRLRTISLVAATLVMCALFVVSRERWREIRHEQVIGDRKPMVDNSSSLKLAAGDDAKTEDTRNSASRLPTAYERVLFTARVPSRQASKRSGSATTALGLVERLMQTPESDIYEAIGSAGFNIQDAVDQLLDLSRQAAVRDDALAALEKLVGVENLAKLATAQYDPKLRESLVRHLLSNDSDTALLAYLSLVDDLSTREQALAVAKQLARPPTERLFAILDSGDRSTRLSAAIALGRLNGPEITESLIARVTENPGGSTETWIALLTCRGDLAKEFLSYAESRPQLLGYYNNARVRRAQMTP